MGFRKHHFHEEIARFASVWGMLCLNTNGVVHVVMNIPVVNDRKS